MRPVRRHPRRREGPPSPAEDVREAVEAVYRRESRRVLATLIRILGDFELAEDALQEAFAADDQLRLIFTYCHPALAGHAQVALTLREVCGLTTEEIARAFLTPTPTLAQRIVRAKRKIRDAVLLEDQDRSRWDRELIREGIELVEASLGSGRIGPYTLQAAISAVHAEAPSPADTDWAQIVALYDVLLRVNPSPVIALNRAVAVAMRDGPETGLAQVDEVLEEGVLDDYHLAHAVRADLCRRLGRWGEAKAAYRRALELTEQGPERRYLEQRLTQLDR